MLSMSTTSSLTSTLVLRRPWVSVDRCHYIRKLRQFVFVTWEEVLFVVYRAYCAATEFGLLSPLLSIVVDVAVVDVVDVVIFVVLIVVVFVVAVIVVVVVAVVLFLACGNQSFGEQTNGNHFPRQSYQTYPNKCLTSRTEK